jgi:hypothetical protein
LPVERRLADVVESVIISADGAAVFVVLECYLNLMVQDAAYKLLSAAAARVPFNSVALRKRGLKLTSATTWESAFESSAPDTRG